MTHFKGARFVSAFILIAVVLIAGELAHAQASLSMGLSVTPTSETDSQGHQTYAAIVTNNGAGAANNLVVTFTMPNIDLPILQAPSSCVFTYNGPLFLTCALGMLAPSASVSVTGVVYPTNVGNLFVTATATESGGSSASALVGSTVTGVGIADVAVFLSANPNPSQVNTPLTYSILAFNIGDDDAQGVVVSLVLPQNVKFVSASKGCSHSATLVNCKVGHMAVSGSKSFDITVTPTVAGWTYATAMLRQETVADPSALNNSAASRLWVNP
jgi:uncharacterized repeat protein (TIGR01451 family)